eukprot:1157693-Pelagomonas_calceolata.AAC.1
MCALTRAFKHEGDGGSGGVAKKWPAATFHAFALFKASKYVKQHARGLKRSERSQEVREYYSCFYMPHATQQVTVEEAQTAVRQRCMGSNLKPTPGNP